MAGIGSAWGSREEMLHPRDRHGRFRKKWKMATSVVDALTGFLDRFQPHQFQSDQQAAQYTFNRRKAPWNGEELQRLHTDWDDANEALQAGEMDDTTKKFVAMMDRNMVETTDDLIVSQTVPTAAFGLTPQQAMQEDGGLEDLIGLEIADAGYSAANIGSELSHPPGSVTLRVAVPKGTRVAYGGRSPNDRALIFDRDQPLVVTKVESDGRGGWYMLAIAGSGARTQGATAVAADRTHGRRGAGLTPEEREARVVPRMSAEERLRIAGNPPMAQRAAEQRGDVPAAPQQTPAPAAAPASPQTPAPPAAGVPERQEPVLKEAVGPGSPEGKSASEIARDAEAAKVEAENAPPPAPAPPSPAEFREATRDIPSPSAGKRRVQWNKAHQGIVTGRRDPADVLRELDTDVADAKTSQARIKRGEDPADPSLDSDIESMDKLADTISERYNIPRRGQSTEAVEASTQAPAAPGKGPTPTPGAPSTKREAAPKKAAPKKAAKRAPADIAKDIDAATTREEAEAQLEGMTGPELTALADHMEAPHAKRATKEQLRRAILHRKGRELDGDAIRDSSTRQRQEAGALTDGQKARIVDRAKQFRGKERNDDERRIVAMADEIEAGGEGDVAAKKFLAKQQGEEKAPTKKAAKAAPAPGRSPEDQAKLVEAAKANIEAKGAAKAAKKAVPAKAAPTPEDAAEEAFKARVAEAGLPDRVTALKAMARDQKIRGFSTMNKRQLQSALLGDEVPKAGKIGVVPPKKMIPHLEAADSDQAARTLLKDHTLKDLKDLAKERELELPKKGATKPRVMDMVLADIRGVPETAGGETPARSLRQELDAQRWVEPADPAIADTVRGIISDTDEMDAADLRNSRDALEAMVKTERNKGNRQDANLIQTLADTMGMRAQTISGVEEATPPVKRVAKKAVPEVPEGEAPEVERPLEKMLKPELLALATKEGAAEVRPSWTKAKILDAIKRNRRMDSSRRETDEDRLRRALEEAGPADLPPAKKAAPQMRVPTEEEFRRGLEEAVPGPTKAVKKAAKKATPGELSQEDMRLLQGLSGAAPGQGGWVDGARFRGQQDRLDALTEQGWLQKFTRPDGGTDYRIDPRGVGARQGPTASGALVGDVLPASRPTASTSLKKVRRGAILRGVRSQDGSSFERIKPGDEIPDESRIARVQVQRLEPVDAEGNPATGFNATHTRITGKDLTTGKRVESVAPGGSHWDFEMLPDSDDTTGVIEGEVVETPPVKKAIKATTARAKKLVPQGSVAGPKAQEKVTTPGRKQSFTEAWEGQGLTAPGAAGRSLDEVRDRIASGEFSPEEGIRRIEADIDFNKEDLAALDAEFRGLGAPGDRSMRAEVARQRRELREGIAAQEKASKFIRDHFRDEAPVTKEDLEIKLAPAERAALERVEIEDLKRTASEQGWGDIDGDDKDTVIANIGKAMAAKEEKARERMRRIGETGTTAGNLAQLDQMAQNNGSDKALEAGIRRLPEADQARLTDALGDRERFRQELDAITQAHGLTRVGRVGETVAYDPQKHEVVGDIAPGSPVLITRAGHDFKPGDGSTVNFKARAIPDTGAPVPAKKAVPSAPETPAGPRRPGQANPSAAVLKTGARILTMQDSDGKWTRTSRKTGSKAITVDRIDRVRVGNQSGYQIHGTDDDGNKVTMEPIFGQNTLTLAPEKVGAPETPAAPKKAAKFLPPLANGTPRKSFTNVEVGDVVKRAGSKGNAQRVVQHDRPTARGGSHILHLEDGSRMTGHSNTAVWLDPSTPGAGAPEAPAPVKKAAKAAVPAPAKTLPSVAPKASDPEGPKRHNAELIGAGLDIDRKGEDRQWMDVVQADLDRGIDGRQIADGLRREADTTRTLRNIGDAVGQTSDPGPAGQIERMERMADRLEAVRPIAKPVGQSKLADQGRKDMSTMSAASAQSKAFQDLKAGKSHTEVATALRQAATSVGSRDHDVQPVRVQDFTPAERTAMKRSDAKKLRELAAEIQAQGVAQRAAAKAAKKAAAPAKKAAPKTPEQDRKDLTGTTGELATAMIDQALERLQAANTPEEERDAISKLLRPELATLARKLGLKSDRAKSVMINGIIERVKGREAPTTSAERAVPSPGGVDESVPMQPYSKTDNMRMHTDSPTMGLVKAYEAAGRNGSANEMLDLRRRATEKGGSTTPQQVVDELKAMRARETDPKFQRELDRAISANDSPMTPMPDLPANTPPAARDLIERLHAIPYARKGTGEDAAIGTVSGDSLVNQVADVLRQLASGESRQQPEMRLRQILTQKVHEMNEPSFRIWELADLLEPVTDAQGRRLPSPLVKALREMRPKQ